MSSSPSIATTSEATNNFVRKMLATHTLAQETIARHGTDDAIFDDSELAILRAYSADPSKKDEILRQVDMADGDGVKAGQGARGKGSLAGYAIATGAVTNEQAKMLDIWFKEGDGSVVA